MGNGDDDIEESKLEALEKQGNKPQCKFFDFLRSRHIDGWVENILESDEALGIKSLKVGEIYPVEFRGMSKFPSPDDGKPNPLVSILVDDAGEDIYFDYAGNLGVDRNSIDGNIIRQRLQESKFKAGVMAAEIVASPNSGAPRGLYTMVGVDIDPATLGPRNIRRPEDNQTQSPQIYFPKQVDKKNEPVNPGNLKKLGVYPIEYRGRSGRSLFDYDSDPLVDILNKERDTRIGIGKVIKSTNHENGESANKIREILLELRRGSIDLQGMVIDFPRYEGELYLLIGFNPETKHLQRIIRPVEITGNNLYIAECYPHISDNKPTFFCYKTNGEKMTGWISYDGYTCDITSPNRRPCEEELKQDINQGMEPGGKLIVTLNRSFPIKTKSGIQTRHDFGPVFELNMDHYAENNEGPLSTWVQSKNGDITQPGADLEEGQIIRNLPIQYFDTILRDIVGVGAIAKRCEPHNAYYTKVLVYGLQKKTLFVEAAEVIGIKTNGIITEAR